MACQRGPLEGGKLNVNLVVLQELVHKRNHDVLNIACLQVVQVKLQIGFQSERAGHNLAEALARNCLDNLINIKAVLLEYAKHAVLRRNGSKEIADCL